MAENTMRTGSLATLTLAILVIAAVAVLLLPAWLGARLILTDGGNGYGQEVWHVGRPVTIAYDFQNRTERTLTVTGIALSHPLPRWTRTVGTGMIPLVPGEGEILARPGRPEQLLPRSRWPRPVQNFRIPPHQHAEYLLTVESTAPGRFTIQGVTLHALYPLPVAAIPIQATNMACTQMAVRVPVRFTC
jgi:hypothetical protein